MTSMINNLLASGPPEVERKGKAAQKPSGEEVERSGFKKSLKKAVQQVEEKSDESGEKIKIPITDGKKKVLKPQLMKKGDSLVRTLDSKSLHLAEESDVENPELPFDALLSLDDKLSSSKVSKKETLKKDVSPEKELKISKEDSSDPVDKIPLLKEPEVNGIKKGEESPLMNEEDGSDDPVIIPFPGEASIQNENVQSQTSQIVEPAVKGEVKVQNGTTKKVKDEPVLTVVDTRSEKTVEIQPDKVVTKTATVVEAVDQSAGDNEPLVLGEQNRIVEAGEEIKTFESRLKESGEVSLARELKDTGNDQIVKKASFVLKDNNQGEIKLILKPEALGRVKIHLNMNENNLVGKIIVENSRVGQIFENNLNNLSKAFEEAGMSQTSLEVSVGDGNRHQQGEGQFNQQETPFYSERLKTLDQAVPTVANASAGGNQLVNLVV